MPTPTTPSKAVLVFVAVLGAAAEPAAGDTLFLFDNPEFPAGVRPSDLAAADFDGDGVVDVAVSNRGIYPPVGDCCIDSGVSLLMGLPDGRLSAAVHHAAGQGPLAIEAGDLNGDGQPDLVVANYVGGVSTPTCACSSTSATALSRRRWPTASRPSPRR